MEIYLRKPPAEVGTEESNPGAFAKFELKSGESVTINVLEDSKLRITYGLLSSSENSVKASRFVHTAFEYNADLGIVTFSGNKNFISPKEAAVMDALVGNLGSITSKSEIATALYPGDELGYMSKTDIDNAIKKYVYRVRSALPPSGNLNLKRDFDDHFIATVFGRGYVLYDPGQANFNPSIFKPQHINE